MWLIDTTTLKLRPFLSSKDVNYAILSHTWGDDDDEVTFNDMADPRRAAKKPGWNKIKKTCEKAKEMHLQYAWVDTCCIDKTSSSELSEAINSMFSWYQDSYQCFVYLATAPDEGPTLEQAAKEPMENYLANFKWFQRGWTLQELIAPSTIVFFDSNWGFIGTKSSLCQTLASITGIDSMVLRRADTLPTVSVGKRFSWAANRRTKRVEDIAYCLLGIFGVNMPLLYGEGSKAFLRLQQEVARFTNDLTLFAWQQIQSSEDTQFRGIFAHSPSEFRHCDNLLTLQERLELETEFTITNRGLRVDRYFGLAGSDTGVQQGDLVMGLDCLERSERTKHDAKWIGVRLRRIGATYVRVLPNDFHYSSSRVSRLNSDLKQVAYIATSLSDLDTAAIHTNRTIGIFYHNSLQAFIPSDTPHGGSSRRRIPYGSMHYVASFGSHGLRSCTHLHLFTIKLGNPTKDFRLALVCGLQDWQLDGGDQGPWALICSEEQFSKSPQHPIHKLNVLAKDTTMTLDEKTEIFRDHIFETYMDKDGRISQSLMPSRLTIKDPDYDVSFITHEISVRIDEASEHRWAENSSEFTYILRLSYHRNKNKGKQPLDPIPDNPVGVERGSMLKKDTDC
ncbi:hypothetical protein CEP54_012922 [Fusarium duplospermum]|uniref:Heterokaryon incompatibility domain-containing protein n=1 Tax=Fusarium duplospermum TaxID=1325734 RepID=A0A428P640_9HYPO|nr:hypothetical protein CEP54_012922 [Fusarium duplospermum]